MMEQILPITEIAQIFTLNNKLFVQVDDDIKLSIPATSGLTLLVPDLVLRNSLIVKAYAGTTNVVTIHGFVNRVATA